MADRIKIFDRFSAQKTADDFWDIVDFEDDGRSTKIPCEFAATPEVAVRLFLFIERKTIVAESQGHILGRNSMRRDIRAMLGVAADD